MAEIDDLTSLLDIDPETFESTTTTREKKPTGTEELQKLLDIDPQTFESTESPIVEHRQLKEGAQEMDTIGALRLGANAAFNVARHYRKITDLSFELAEPIAEKMHTPMIVASGALYMPFRLFGTAAARVERETIGRGMRALMPERIQDKLGATPSAREIIHALGPDLRSVMRDVGLRRGDEFTIVELPDGQLDIHMRPGMDFAKVAEFGMEMGMGFANPLDWLSIIALGKGADVLVRSEAGQKFLHSMAKSLPVSLQKGMEWGTHKVPAELEEMIDVRNIRIQRALKTGETINEKMLALTPAERTRIHQIRLGGMSVRPEERKIRTYARAYGKFLDYMTKQLIASGVPSKEATAILKKNIGSYAPRLYSIFEKTFRKGNIPNDLLARIWSMEPSQVEALARLDPKLAKHFKGLVEKISKKPAYEASGFKTLRVRVKEMLKGRMERKLVARDIEKLRKESLALKTQAKEITLDDLPRLGEFGLEGLKRKGYTVEKIASMEPDALVKASGQKINEHTMRRAREAIGEAKELFRQKRSLLGRAEAYKGHLKFLPEKALAETADFRYALGEIRDPAYLLARRSAQSITSSETAQVFNRLAGMRKFVMEAGKKPGLLSTLEGKWTQMPMDSSYGRLAGRWVRNDVFNKVNEIQMLANRVPNAMIKSMQAWKFGKVVLSPSTHCRNLMSNAILMRLSGVPESEIPGLILEATGEILRKGGWYKNAFKHGAITNDYLSSELGLIRARLLEPTETGHMFERASNIVRDGFSLAGKAYQTEEQIFKLAKFMYEVRKGRGAWGAAKEAQEWLFNYNKIPPLIRKLREHPLGVPFITFPYKALPKVFKSLRNDPTVLASYEVFFRALDRASAGQRGLSAEHAMDEKRVASREDALYTRYVRLPFTDERDNPYFLDMTYILPWGDISELDYTFGTPRAFTAGGLSRPLLDIAYNLKYADREIVKPGESVIEAMQGWAEHLWKFYMPSLLGFGGTRLYRAAKGRSEYHTGLPQPIPLAVADVLLGMKTRGMDIERRHEQKLRYLERAKQDQESEINYAGRNMERGVISQGEFNRILEQKVANMQKIDAWLEQIESLDVGKK